MKSPFPGMDPFLEPHWLDVHGALIAETRRLLNRFLPTGLVARMEERVAIDADDDRELRAGPDVSVFKPSSGPWSKEPGGAVVIDAPYRLVVDVQPVIERFIRIVNDDGQLITVVEFISPSNKRGPGLDAYLTKRSDLLAAGVHVVEIDLVRAGNWQALFRPHVCSRGMMSLYRATVRTAGLPITAYLYPIHLQDRLPDVQIPLRLQDPKVMLPLQPMLETIYADGRYGTTLNYNQTLEPSLTPEEQQYVLSQIASRPTLFP